jgi:gamma-glutamyltranspeptidase / glutathione hydrolase
VISPAVAAGHRATAEAGAEVLMGGGSAADAAVAASLASCVAETVMTGLLGGGHAVYLDAATGRTENLDCFVAAPGLGAARQAGAMVDVQVPFGQEIVHYSIGPASFGVPGVPAGLDALWRRWGRLPWARLVEPALRLARAGVELPPAHASCLAMLEPVMTMDAGARIYSPGGKLLVAGDRLDQPGLIAALEAVAAEGAAAVYSGSLAPALLALMDDRGGQVTGADLAAYEAVWSPPREARRGGYRILTRGGLSGITETLARLPTLDGRTEAQRVLALVEALDGPQLDGHTTNLVTVDDEGSACVLTTSLGLGSGDFLPGYDLHLNSMLGEADLHRGPLEPGARMESMMAPTVVFDGDGLVLAAGAAGGTRLRTALVGVLTAILDEGIDPQSAVDRPRVHPAGDLSNAEPGVGEAALAALEAAGRTVRRWPARHHYFGGVSVLARSGAAADPRRNGAVVQSG